MSFALERPFARKRPFARERQFACKRAADPEWETSVDKFRRMDYIYFEFGLTTDGFNVEKIVTTIRVENMYLYEERWFCITCANSSETPDDGCHFCSQ